MSGKTTYVIALFLLLLGCIDPVELDLEKEAKIVVISQDFYPGDPLTILLARSQPLFGESQQHLNEALVSISEDGKPIATLSYESNSNGLYGTNDRVIPEPGREYAITVDAPGLESVSAINIIPEKIPIKKLEVPYLRTEKISDGQTEYSYGINIVIDDPGTVENYYHINFVQLLWNYSILGKDTLLFPFPNLIAPTIVQRNISEPILSHPEGGALIKDDLFNGQEKSFEFDASVVFFESQQVIGQMVVELRTVSEDYYLYHSSLARQSQSTGSSNISAFDEPTSVFTNIKNGFGIFAGYSFDLKAVNIK